MPTRETMISPYYWDDMRLQYSDETEEARNPERVSRMGQELAESSVELIEALGEYKDAMTEKADEDSASRMKYARRQLIEKWGKMQASVSAVPLTFHFTGDEAFDRFVQSIADTDKPLDFSDL